jgi:hypothetical protein
MRQVQRGCFLSSDVKQFGAKGDGFTGDAAALVAADAAPGTVLYFPPGTYRIATSLTLAKPVVMGEGLGQLKCPVACGVARSPDAPSAGCMTSAGWLAGCCRRQHSLPGGQRCDPTAGKAAQAGAHPQRSNVHRQRWVGWGDAAMCICWAINEVCW